MKGYLCFHPVTRARFQCRARDRKAAQKLAGKHFHFRAWKDIQAVEMHQSHVNEDKNLEVA